jgi:hypothetical protein
VEDLSHRGRGREPRQGLCSGTGPRQQRLALWGGTTSAYERSGHGVSPDHGIRWGPVGKGGAISALAAVSVGTDRRERTPLTEGREPGGDPGHSRRSEARGDWQEVYDRATAAQKMRYTELMRTDPIAGTAYLEAIALRKEAEGESAGGQ